MSSIGGVWISTGIAQSIEECGPINLFISIVHLKPNYSQWALPVEIQTPRMEDI
ncbi:unnamed protein product, partial [marine sediment metagenome]